jgi:hypothetical protein
MMRCKQKAAEAGAVMDVVEDCIIYDAASSKKDKA